MINYRVDDLAALIAHLEKNGVPIVKGPEHRGCSGVLRLLLGSGSVAHRSTS